MKALIRTIPGFPVPGVQFRDITSLLAHGRGLFSTVEHLALAAGVASVGKPFNAIAGIEARGFMFGAALAIRLGVGFVPLRKAGKLPGKTIGIDYALEYGIARLEMDPSAITMGKCVLLVDDLIATGGTALAGTHLLRQAGAVIEHALFVIDLPDLGGAKALRDEGVQSAALIHFDGQ